MSLNSSLPPELPPQPDHGQHADGQSDHERSNPQVPFDLFLQGRDDAEHRGGGADDALHGKGNVQRVAHDWSGIHVNFPP